MIRHMNTTSSKKSTALRDTEWVSKARSIHGDRYDYSRASYVNRHSPVEILCKTHGQFMQAMSSHLKGAGCPACVGLKRVSAEDFLAAANVAHAGRYTYDLESYTGWQKPVRVRCVEHGWFEQIAVDHVKRTSGCPTCGYSRAGIRRRNPSAIESLGLCLIHPEFSGMGSPVGIVCPTHGPYVVARAGDVVYNGVRCPRCAHTVSAWEAGLGEYLTSLGVTTVRTREIISPKEIDLYSKEHSVGVECHGVRFHSTAFLKNTTVHLNKLRLAEKAGIRLLQVFEDEWKYRRAAVENLLAAAFGKAHTTHARKCTVVETDSAAVAAFLDANHIQGAAKGSVVLSLQLGGSTKAVMVFSKVTSERGAKDAGWELVRYASVGRVVGGASRLFRAFVTKYHPERVISYSDRRLFTGGMYSKLGFTKVHDTRPGYTVLVGDRRWHKAGFKKSLLARKLGADVLEGKTEREICESQGWFRVYDCGLTKWEWKL